MYTTTVMIIYLTNDMKAYIEMLVGQNARMHSKLHSRLHAGLPSKQ